MANRALSKESIIKLEEYQHKFIRVKFQGGREVTGVLKSFDQQLNLILDGTIETIRDKEDPYVMTQNKRTLGLTIIRGQQITNIYPMEGSEVIDNPFLEQDQEEQE